MKLRGTIETDFSFAMVRVHLGEKDGQDWVQVSFPIIGDMNNDARDAIANGRTDQVILSDESSNNGKEISRIEMFAYMSKNLMFLRKGLRSDESCEITRDNSISMIPCDWLENGFPRSTKLTCNLQEFYTAI